MNYWQKIMVGIVSGIGGATLAQHNWAGAAVCFIVAFILYWFWEL